jgi:probable LLM family oxidoreductase
VELGLITFADQAPSTDPRRTATRLKELLEEIELADRLGLDVYGVGEHHRPDYAVSSPAVALAAAAARTESIRLTSAVTVLSSTDPVRVFQDFATVDLISEGRAEIMAGRGSFTESFALFGNRLEEYDELFAEKLELLLKLRESVKVTWSGRHRPALQDAPIYPRPLQQPLPVWIAVGGTPQSVARAGLLGLPLTIAIIGGAPARFLPLVELYREAVGRSDANTTLSAIAINQHMYIAATAKQARDEFFPHYSQMMNRIGRERGWPPMTRAQFDASCEPGGHLLVGSPEEVTEKILATHDLFLNDRLLGHITVGTLPHEQGRRAIELFATEVAPAVRQAVRSTAPTA